MAHRSMDNGRDETPGARRTLPTEPSSPRAVDVAPPGSRERAESDLTGWNPARDEESSTRQGRYHRAATLRMSQPRTQVDDAPDTDLYGAPPEESDSGPYGRDDRDSRYATGWGPLHDTGEQDVELPRQRADYRPWNRFGYGAGDAPSRAQSPRGEPSRLRGEERHGAARPRYQMDRSHADSNGWHGATASASGAPDEASTHRREGASTSVYTAIAGRPEARPVRRERARRWHPEPLTAREVMTRNVRTARPENPLRDVAQIMKDESCGAVPIVDGQGRLAGIVTDRDLVVRAFTGSRAPEQLRVSDVMTDDVEAVTPDDSLLDVIALMGRRQLRRVPVVERDDHIVGIISLGDIALRADQDDALQRALERISARRSFWSRLG